MFYISAYQNDLKILKKQFKINKYIYILISLQK